jgi:putative endonuclease
MSFHVYILHSRQLDKYYVGSTGEHLAERIKRHVTEYKGFTGKTKDWKLVYQEKFDTKEVAERREIEIKGWKSRIKIAELIKTQAE